MVFGNPRPFFDIIRKSLRPAASSINESNLRTPSYMHSRRSTSSRRHVSPANFTVYSSWLRRGIFPNRRIASHQPDPFSYPYINSVKRVSFVVGSANSDMGGGGGKGPRSISSFSTPHIFPPTYHWACRGRQPRSRLLQLFPEFTTAKSILESAYNKR